MKARTLSALGLGLVIVATLPVYAAGGHGGKGGMRGMNMFQQLDADGDGTVTKAEFDAFSQARFAELDGDADGALTQEEILAHRGEGRRGGMRGAPTEEQRAEMAARMIERRDTNGDGQLSADEIAAPVDMFAALDADEDGLLSREEFEAMQAKGRHKGRWGKFRQN